MLAVGPISTEEKKAITEYFHGKHGWWHWISGFWLIIDSSGKLTAEHIRDHVHAVAPHARILVLDVQKGSDWAGIGPQTKEKDMFRWINNRGSTNEQRNQRCNIKDFQIKLSVYQQLYE